MSKTISEKGKYKQEIQSALYNNKELCELLIGNIDGMSTRDVLNKFREHVFSHLFIDDTIEDTSSFVFYDIEFPMLDPRVKTCKIIMYAVCHRDILDNYYSDRYIGNRADILAQMIEDTLINDQGVANNFGIGELTLDSVSIYNSHRMYGNVLIFNVPNFR